MRPRNTGHFDVGEVVCERDGKIHCKDREDVVMNRGGRVQRERKHVVMKRGSGEVEIEIEREWRERDREGVERERESGERGRACVIKKQPNT